MNENLNLVEILKDCPKGTKLYSTIHGEVEFEGIGNSGAYRIELKTENEGFACLTGAYRIELKTENEGFVCLTSDGRHLNYLGGECILFPSKDQRDWSKFKIKKPKFDPKTLKPFDKVLVRDYDTEKWNVGHFSYIEYDFTYIDLDLDLSMCERTYKSVVYTANGETYLYAVPYNDDTNYLVGKKEEAPEFYRYWED